MHRYKIVAQISLILSILNLILADPVGVWEIHKARADMMVVAEDVAAKPKKWRKLEAASARLTSSRSPPDALGSSQHSSSSGYPTPHLSSDESVSGYSWMLDRPPRLSLHSSASSYGSAPPHLALLPPSPAGSPNVTPLQDSLEEGPMSYSTSDRFTSPHDSSGPHSPPNPWWWLPYSPADRSSTDFSSASDGSLSSLYFSASEGLTSTHSSPAMVTVPQGDKFFNKNMVRKLKIVAGAVIVGGAIAGIVGSQIKHMITRTVDTGGSTVKDPGHSRLRYILLQDQGELLSCSPAVSRELREEDLPLLLEILELIIGI